MSESETRERERERPKRIQRQRTKGWRMPENAVYVGRPTKWGNPFVVGEAFHAVVGPGEPILAEVRGRQHAVDLYRAQVAEYPGIEVEVRTLRGKNLVCWCPLDQPCHADVLLEWANA